jgi:hypothetical protein
MMTRVQLAVAITVCMMACAGKARADLLVWSFTLNKKVVLNGVFTGTDAGNYFTVTGLQSLDVNGSPTNYLAGLPVVSQDAFVGAGEGYYGNGSAVVTLDGSYLDLFDTPGETNGQLTGLSLAVNDNYAQDVQDNVISYTDPPKFIEDQYKKADWSATLVVTEVPEPSTVAVLLTGMVGLGIARGRKAV